MTKATENIFDVVIGGGGLAGLSLARQLRLYLPQLSVAVVEKLARPLPEAAFKVGESTVEVGAHYIGEILQLQSYLERSQYRKFGLRYFLGDSAQSLHSRGEWGTDQNLPVPSYQLDRGVLEHDLRGLLEETGVALFENHDVVDATLAEAEEDHLLRILDRSNKEEKTLRCRWFVDALGRRRLLQTKLGLKKESPHRASAVWFRMEGRLDVDDLVGAGQVEWHSRVPAKMRYFSTNHFMGRGYWAWLIPLASGNTSVGIVTDENIHPYSTYCTYSKAVEWLERYEPELAMYLSGRETMDFKGVRNYSHLSSRVFSHRRWACVGEAGIFLDPLYSPGTDVIGIGNTITVELISLDQTGSLTPKVVNRYNRFFKGFVDTFLETYTNRYAVFGTQQVAREKFLWDTCLYWVWTGQIFFRHLLSAPQLIPQLLDYGVKFSLLHKRVQDLFCDWAAAVPSKADFRFLAPYDIPFFKYLHDDLTNEKPLEQILEDFGQNLDRFEEWANILFFRALAEVHPDKLEKFPQPRWVNAWGINLDPSRWEIEKLFQPSSRPRNLQLMEAALAPTLSHLITESA